MQVQGYEITDDQLAAAKAAMVGKFSRWAVRQALSDAGFQGCTDRAADAIMQRARKAGFIRVAPGSGMWIANS